jgi:hypothetical protein
MGFQESLLTCPPSLSGWSRIEFSITEITTGLLYQLLMMMMKDDECGAADVMLARGNRSTKRKHVQMPLFPPQIPHDLTRA